MTRLASGKAPFYLGVWRRSPLSLPSPLLHPTRVLLHSGGPSVAGSDRSSPPCLRSCAAFKAQLASWIKFSPFYNNLARELLFNAGDRRVLSNSHTFRYQWKVEVAAFESQTWVQNYALPLTSSLIGNQLLNFSSLLSSAREEVDRSCVTSIRITWMRAVVTESALHSKHFASSQRPCLLSPFLRSGNWGTENVTF